MEGEQVTPRVGARAGGRHPSSTPPRDTVQPLFPQLRPGPSKAPAAAAAHQRARLHAAMIEACARHGYAETTVREVAGLAGVSSKTLYKHFESKEACFLATYDLVVQQAIGRISAAHRDASGPEKVDWVGGLCRAFDAFTDELVQRPAASRLALIDIFAALPGAASRIDRAELLFMKMISESLALAPDGVVIPPRIVRALVGGIWFVARARLLESRARSLTAGSAELREWLLVYRSPASSKLPVSRPGRQQPTHDRRTLDVAAALERGRVDDPERPLALLEWLSADALAEALRETEAASSWAGGVCRAVESIFGRLASDTDLARAAFLDGFAVGPADAERRTAILRGFADVLVRRAPRDGRPSPLLAEAIVGSVWSIAHRSFLFGQPKTLPASSTRAAFLVLAPILGAEQARAAILARRDT